LSVNLQNPVKARLLMKLKSSEAATELAGKLRDDAPHWLRLQDSNLVLCAERPDVETDGANLEARFDVPENSARLLLQRIAKTDAPAVLAEQ
ncbi:MAG: hypothetical protein M3Z64_12505, partial [Verrucomicrobiota bacterium]|nr:hypothetical protein [Verrucomicrobiota bacterium]